MTRLDKLLIGFGACLALVISAAMLADGIARAGPFTDNDQPNRWIIQQNLSDGVVMFDTSQGRLV